MSFVFETPKTGRENCGAAVGYYRVGIVVSITDFAESWKQKTGVHLSSILPPDSSHSSSSFSSVQRFDTGSVAIFIYHVLSCYFLIG